MIIQFFFEPLGCYKITRFSVKYKSLLPYSCQNLLNFPQMLLKKTLSEVTLWRQLQNIGKIASAEI
jgi:hypothetical protein